MSLKNKIDQFELERNENQKRIEGLENQRNEFKNKIDQFELERNENHKRIEGLENQRNEFKNKIDQFELERNENQKRIEGLENQRNNLIKDLDELDKKLKNHTQSFNKIKSVIDTYNSDYWSSIEKGHDSNTLNKSFCYYCFSESVNVLGQNKVLKTKVFSCNNCGLIQSEFINKNYIDTYYHAGYKDSRKKDITNDYISFMKSRAKSQYKFIIDKSPMANKKNCKIIDIGSGIGELVNIFSDHGKTYAVENDPKMLNFLSSNSQANVIEEEMLFRKDYYNFFDLIAISHVFEHINNPLEYLYRLSLILKIMV